MSPIDFDQLETDAPDLGEAWAALKIWFTENRDQGFAPLAALIKEISNLDRTLLAFALIKMVEHRMLLPVYRVRARSGKMLDGEYPAPEVIPPTVIAMADDTADKDESGIIGSFYWSNVSAA